MFAGQECELPPGAKIEQRVRDRSCWVGAPIQENSPLCSNIIAAVSIDGNLRVGERRRRALTPAQRNMAHPRHGRAPSAWGIAHTSLTASQPPL